MKHDTLNHMWSVWDRKRERERTCMERQCWAVTISDDITIVDGVKFKYVITNGLAFMEIGIYESFIFIYTKYLYPVALPKCICTQFMRKESIPRVDRIDDAYFQMRLRKSSLQRSFIIIVLDFSSGNFLLSGNDYMSS